MEKIIAAVHNRRTLWLHLAIMLLALQLTACSTPQSWLKSETVKSSGTPLQDSSQAEFLRQAADLQDRLERVAGPLLIANPALCKRHTRNLLGISARNKYSFNAQLAEPAEKMFGLGDHLQVMNVLPGSGAEKAGIKRNDILVAVESKAIPKGENAESEAVALLAPLVAKKNNVKLTVRRDDSERDITVPLTNACGFRVELGNSDSINSYSDGRRILVTRGMMRFARNDSELAYVVAKEMAHSVLNHPNVLKTSSAATGIIDRMVRGEKIDQPAFASLKPMPQKYDIAADTLSLYMAARAGHDLDSAPAFWQRLAEQYPAGSPELHTTQHPATRARLSAMTKAVPKVKASEEKRKTASSD